MFSFSAEASRPWHRKDQISSEDLTPLRFLLQANAHRHEHDYLYVVIGDGRLQGADAEGERWQANDMKDGEVRFNEVEEEAVHEAHRNHERVVDKDGDVEVRRREPTQVDLGLANSNPGQSVVLIDVGEGAHDQEPALILEALTFPTCREAGAGR